MRIVSLELRNVRHLDRKRLEFTPGFNLLVGENGRGKSTVLRSLLTALGAEKNLRPAERLGDDDIRHRAREFSISVDYREGETPFQAGADRSWRGKTKRRGKLPSAPIVWFGANESTAATLQGKLVRRYESTSPTRREPDEIRMREEYLHREEFPDFPEEEERSGFGRSMHVRRFVSRALSTFSPKFERFGWRFVPYGCHVQLPAEAAREGKRAAAFRREVQAEVMRFLEEDFYPERRFRGWGSRRVVKFRGNGEPIEKRDYMRSMPELGRIMESAGRRLELSSGLKESTIEIRLAPRITVFGPDGPFLLGQLSDGEKRLFSMIVDVARQLSLAQGGWREIEHASAIVLIDEIDCHLHPRWQRMIVPALEDLFPACQFIASTHSPFIVQAVEAHQLQSLGPLEPLPDFTDKGIDEIAFKVMHVRNPEVSRRYLEMLDAAKEFYAAAYGAKQASNVDREALRRRLHELSSRFARNPAFQAFLELKAEGLLGADA